MNVNFINFSKPVTGSFLVDIIFWLVQISTSVTLGVILFTVLLKLITLPFDFFSRASMRKNSLKMEQMRPELEKLQKQYSDNKDLYNQKMMALYKKNGYSMFGSCLPTILTLVIFIVAINAFTDYSKFQNRQYFYDMSASYNNVIYEGMELDTEYITRNDDGVLVINASKLKGEFDNFTSGQTALDLGENYAHDINLAMVEDSGNKYFTVSTTNSYVKCIIPVSVKDGTETLADTREYVIVKENLVDNTVLANQKNNNLKIKAKDENGKKVEYAFNDQKAVDLLYANRLDQAYEKYVKETKKDKGTPISKEEFTTKYKTENPIDAYKENGYILDFIMDIRQEKSAETFRAENQQFLWVKNIWVTDSPTAHPVVSSWKTFKSTHGYPSSGEDIKEDGYNQLIAKLDYEKSAPNGYFILVVLTAGMSFLMQVVMGKSQKAQMELQTVDGQGAQTQKIMKWMMPIMMAFFAFMYTAAFSLYIVVSNVLSIGTTYGINFIVDRRFKKAEGLNGEKKVIRGRVYTPKEEPKEEPKKDKKSKNEPPKADFLSGTADVKKHVRGRIK